jgi:hypothetical protein
MTRRALRTLVVAAVAGGVASTTLAGGVASATLPPDDGGGTDFVRRQAEEAATAFFAETDPSVSDVACAAPPADEAGAQMRCYGTDSAGNVVVAVATINDLGGIEVAAGQGPPPTAPPSTAPSPVLASYNGSGSAARPVDPITAPTIVRVTHEGAGAFAVQPTQGSVPAGAALVSATGPWDGRYLVGLGGTISGFAITADGNWTLELLAVSSALPLAPGSPAAGDRPDVLRYSSAEALPVTIEYTGTTGIVVRVVTRAGAAVVTEQTGAFAGDVELPPGPGNVLVEAVGSWSVTPPAPPPTTTVAPTTAAPTTTPATGAPTTVQAPSTAAATTTTSAP